MTLQELAAQYAAMFTQDVRESGETFVKTIDDCPEELTSLIHAAHGDMLPDDWRYNCIWNALLAFAEYDDPDSVIDDVESDPYHSDLLRWLSSHTDRPYYVNQYVEQYVEEFGKPNDFDLMQLIGFGQWMEKREVYSSVLESLQELVEAMEEDLEEEDLEEEAED